MQAGFKSQACRGALLLLCGVLAACSWRDDLDGERRRPEGLSEAPVERRTVTDTEDVAIDLFASRPLASVFRQGALVIDATTADFVKYIDGGVRADWQRGVRIPADEPGAPAQAAALVRGLGAQLHFPLDQDQGGIELADDVLKIRFTAKSAVAKQLVSVFLNEHKLGDVSMPTTAWQDYVISAPRSVLVQGENKLRFYFRSSADVQGHRSAAAFQRFVIGESPSNAAGLVQGRYQGAGPAQPALQVNAPSRISYYARIPVGSTALHVDVAGESDYAIAVRAAGEKARRILTGKGTTRWTSSSVDLRAYQGKVVRLDFLSSGPLAWARPRILRPVEEPADHEWAPPQRIVLLSISSLRSDRLRLDVGRNLRRFLEQGFGVLEMQASSPSAGTAHASLMSGRLRTQNRVDEEVTTIAEALRKAGFATALVSGNGFVNDAAGFAQGFGYYDNPMRRQHHAGAKTLWRQAKRFLLEHGKERVFVHIAMVEPHMPYRPTDEALAKEWAQPPLFAGAKTVGLAEQIASGRRVATPLEQSFVRALYDASVADVDAAVAEILGELAALELAGETAVILAGDHGEELWERGRFGHSGSLKQEVLQTPFAIQYSQIEELRPPKRASTADIGATILDLADVKNDSSEQGKSLLSDEAALDERPFFSGTSDGSRALLLGQYKLIAPAGGALELYDLHSDPGEHKSRVDDLPVVTRALRNVLATGVAYEDVWSAARWGQASSPLEAFARDQGM